MAPIHNYTFDCDFTWGSSVFHYSLSKVSKEALLISSPENRITISQLKQILHPGRYPKFDWARPEQPDLTGVALCRIGLADLHMSHISYMIL